MNILIEKNVMVPMRDGVKLATDIYRPAEEGQYPVLLSRLPYNKEFPGMLGTMAGTALRAVQKGYVVVYQDCRGRFAAAGTPGGRHCFYHFAQAHAQPAIERPS